MFERRFVKGATVEVRAKSDTRSDGLEGYGAVFNEDYVLYEDSGFRVVETIKPGAFARALREKQDVRCLFNHNTDNVLGRTTNDTLRLNEDQKGLRFDDDLDMRTPIAQSVAAFVDRRDVTGCSFAFVVRKATWTEDIGDTMETWTRTIEDVDLYDVGPVTYPAYEGTSVGNRAAFEQRSHDMSDMPAKVRARLTGQLPASELARARAKQRLAEISLT